MTISSPERTGEAPKPAEVCAVLRRAANALERLPHLRVGRLDLYLALRRSGPYQVAQAALEVLAAHLHATGADDLWVHRMSVLRNREDAVVLMRDAADAAEKAAVVSR